jgi:hypothetical protein
MYEEWHGLGQYQVSNPGGLARLEKEAPSWRKEWGTGEQKHFSRLKTVVAKIDEEVAASGVVGDVLERYEQIFEGHSSLTAMAKYVSR